jgi:uncharacterized cupin superfamily protein
MANHPSVVGDGDLEWSEHSRGEKFGSRRKQLGSSAGGEKLGCSLYEVPPGRRAWPYHYHLANEEAIYVLEGSGTLRIGGEEIGVSRVTTWRCQRERKRLTSSSTTRGRCSGTSATPR